jgi:hypothetical protein
LSIFSAEPQILRRQSSKSCGLRLMDQHQKRRSIFASLDSQRRGRRPAREESALSRERPRQRRWRSFVRSHRTRHSSSLESALRGAILRRCWRTVKQLEPQVHALEGHSWSMWGGGSQAPRLMAERLRRRSTLVRRSGRAASLYSPHRASVRTRQRKEYRTCRTSDLANSSSFSP